MGEEGAVVLSADDVPAGLVEAVEEELEFLADERVFVLGQRLLLALEQRVVRHFERENGFLHDEEDHVLAHVGALDAEPEALQVQAAWCGFGLRGRGEQVLVVELRGLAEAGVDFSEVSFEGLRAGDSHAAIIN